MRGLSVSLMCLLTPYFVNAYCSLNSILCNSGTASYRSVSAPYCIFHAYQFYIDSVGYYICISFLSLVQME